jgi:NMT1/THI5 like
MYLARGRAEFGLFPPNRLLVRRERGEALVAVAAVNHEGLEAVQVAAKSGVERPGGNTAMSVPLPKIARKLGHHSSL